MTLLPVRLRFQDRVVVRIERRLPGPGKVLVKPGDQVTPEETVGESQISGGYRKINLSGLLGLGSKEVAKSLLKKPGDVVYKGEPLARSSKFLGLKRRVYLSPVDGVVEELLEGEVTIRFAPTEVKVASGFTGTIESVSEGEAVTVRTNAAKIRGIVGAGHERFGHIRIVGKPGEFLLPQHIDSSDSGKIVVGGAIVTSDTIEKALAIGVRGLVTGGINFHETLGWSEGSDIGLTIVSLEGYGFHPINEDLFKDISRFDGKYASISGPDATVIISIEGSAQESSSPSWRDLKLGDSLRIISGEGLGRVGLAEAVSTKPVQLDSGLMASVITLKVGSEKMMIPWQNLEIVEIASDPKK